MGGRASSTVEALRRQIQDLEADVDRLYKDNQRLRWRHETVIPEWNDLPNEVRSSLCRLGEIWTDEHAGGDFMVNFYAEVRDRLRADAGREALRDGG